MTDSIYVYDGMGKVPDHISAVIVQDGVREIGQGAFYNCRILLSIHIPDTVGKIGKYAFGNCESLASINLPPSVTIIEQGAFLGCELIISMSLPSSIQEIGEGVFSSCSSLTTIQLPAQINVIQRSTFEGCTSLLSIDLPSSITEIHDHAFGHCVALPSITMPSSISYIGHCAFEYCKSLTSITLPLDINCIVRYAFYGCMSLQTINFKSKIIVPTKNDNSMGLLKDIERSTTDQDIQTQCRVDSMSPLHFHLMFGTVEYYKDKIAEVISENPSSLTSCDPIYNMYPCLLAACTPRKKDYNDMFYDSEQHLETVFVLLREAPWVIDMLINKKIISL